MRPSSAAQCVANIACTELPQGLWPDLIGLLCQNITNPGSTEMMKESCLEAIGYICQDIVSGWDLIEVVVDFSSDKVDLLSGILFLVYKKTLFYSE